MQIKIRNLQKYYGNFQALNKLNLEIEEGMYGLLGPNGAGKTTLMKILTTVFPPTAGEVFIDDINVNKYPEKIRELIGYLPQNYGLYNNVSVDTFLKFVGVLKGIAKDDVKKEVERVLDIVNLNDKKSNKIKNLSGGMKQRVGIAQALMGDPEIIIVDEPTAGLDPEERSKFRNLLITMSIGKIIILSTHIVADIEGSCNKLGVLNKGEILYQGDLEGLKNQSNNRLFELRINPEEFRDINEQYRVVNVKRDSDVLVVQVLSTGDIAGARRIEPTLEGGYFCLLNDFIP